MVRASRVGGGRRGSRIGTISVAPAAADEWEIASPGKYPGGLECAAASGSKACFDPDTDNIWVQDTRANKMSAIAKWRVPFEGRSGHCRNRLKAPNWGFCSPKDFQGQSTFYWWSSQYDRESNSFPGPWSAGHEAFAL